MADTTVVAMPSPLPSYIDWGPVIGGAFVAAAVSSVLLAFGAGAGIATVSPYSWNNPSGTTLSILAAAWFLVVVIGSALAGGYFAGRFRRPVGDTMLQSEREMRDGAHGLLVWAIGLVIGTMLAVSATTATIRGVAGAAGNAAAGMAQNVSADRVSSLLDGMMRPAPQAANANNPNADSPRVVASRILSSSALTRGEISNEDRTYLAQVVAAQAGIPEDEARRRVDATIEQAKQAANEARKAAIILAFLIGAASIVSAGAAFWGATAGGEQRDKARV